MAFRKVAQSKVAVAEVEVTKPILPEIDELGFGDYAADDFAVKQYKSVYYAIRELQGYSVRRKLNEDFNWEEYKAKFAAVFGTPEEQKHSLEQLVAYSIKKFNKGLEGLIAFNHESWNRRNARESMYAEEFGHPAIAKVNEILANVAANAQAVLNEPTEAVETLVTNVDDIPY